MKIQRYISINVIVDLRLAALQHKSIFLASEMIAPQALFAADNEIGVIFLFCPCERRRRVEADLLSSKSDFACFQYEQKNYVAQSSREQRTNTRSEPRICLH